MISNGAAVHTRRFGWLQGVPMAGGGRAAHGRDPWRPQDGTGVALRRDVPGAAWQVSEQAEGGVLGDGEGAVRVHQRVAEVGG